MTQLDRRDCIIDQLSEYFSRLSYYSNGIIYKWNEFEDSSELVLYECSSTKGCELLCIFQFLFNLSDDQKAAVKYYVPYEWNGIYKEHSIKDLHNVNYVLDVIMVPFLDILLRNKCGMDSLDDPPF